ncbi:MAG: DegT/DnrJ/EryC1/StrS family aminotransferase [Candidatus Limnocylindria bacterium]
MIPIARPQVGEEEKALVWSAMESGQLAQGSRVREFEEDFTHFVGATRGVATSSGTTAIHLALLALGIGPGDEVVTVSFTFTATVSPILHVGATPVFVDVDPETFTMDVSGLAAVIGPRTKAIIPVSLYGLPADMPSIVRLADRHGLVVIEDACQAHGAKRDGTSSGAWGIGVFSFYPTKNMTTGEGGMITTEDPALADRATLLREHGMRERYRPEILGYNFRMTDVHASIGLGQLPKLAASNERRRAIAAKYDAELEGVITPAVPANVHHVYHQYTLRVARQQDFAGRLADRGVGSNIYYPVPVHRQDPFRAAGLGSEQLPVTERLVEEILSIPIHPTLSDAEVDTIIEAVNTTARELGPPPSDG